MTIDDLKVDTVFRLRECEMWEKEGTEIHRIPLFVASLAYKSAVIADGWCTLRTLHP
jgi:hypothetical protein